MIKVIIAGSRKFNNYTFIKEKLNNILHKYTKVEIVCGEAYGPDTLGKRWGLEKGYSIKSFPAEWNKYGKSAGYIRNEEMAKYSTHLIAFWDGTSKGTNHMINLAKKYNLIIKIIKV